MNMIDLTAKKVFLQNTNILVPLEENLNIGSIMTSLRDTGCQSKFVKLRGRGKKHKIKVIDFSNENCFD